MFLSLYVQLCNLVFKYKSVNYIDRIIVFSPFKFLLCILDVIKGTQSRFIKLVEILKVGRKIAVLCFLILKCVCVVENLKLEILCALHIFCSGIRQVILCADQIIVKFLKLKIITSLRCLVCP